MVHLASFGILVTLVKKFALTNEGADAAVEGGSLAGHAAARVRSWWQW